MNLTSKDKAILRKWGVINPGGVGAYTISKGITDLIKGTKPIKKWQKELYQKYLKEIKSEKKGGFSGSPKSFPQFIKYWLSMEKI